MTDERRSKRSSGTALRFFGRRKTEKEKRENSRIRKVRKLFLGVGRGLREGKTKITSWVNSLKGKKERGGEAGGKKKHSGTGFDTNNKIL